jgi:hypothetical protein
MRIFVGPVEIAGYYRSLSHGLAALGHDVTYATYYDHPFQYGGGEDGPLLRLIRYAGQRYTASRSGRRPTWPFWAAAVQFIRVLLFLRYAMTHDVFVFGFGKSLLPLNCDLPVLRLLRRRIIMNVAHGSDLRPPYLDGQYSQVAGPAALRNTTIRVHRRARVVQKYADVIIGAPYSSQFCTRPFINMLALGLPYHGSMEPRVDSGSHVVRIVHAPSNPGPKGTALIRVAVERLRARGHAIEYIEIVGRPNREVLDELARCDFVVDQLYSDTPLAGLGTEAAWFGKPAVVGGYGLAGLRDHLPPEMFPPSHICHPDEVEQAIERLIVDARYRTCLGAAAQRFVRERWTAEAVAARFAQLMGDVPQAWLLDPRDIVYVHGAGMPEQELHRQVRSIIDNYGVDALRLDARPDVRQALLALVAA